MKTFLKNDAPQPSEKKGFKAALTVFFAQQVPQLGGSLTRQPVVEHIAAMVEQYYPSPERMKVGQMLWFAVDKAETAGYGKSLDTCKQQPVILDVLYDSDIEDVLQGIKKRTRQQKVAVRLFDQAYEQGGVLTLADVGSILRLAPATVSRYVVEYEKENGKVVPRRGTIHDMGPTLTHKKTICTKLFAEGKTVEQTAQETNHSTAAVVRYGNDFRRVRECLKADWDTQRIAFATGLSKSVTKQYVDMLNCDELPF
jgi:hypothetical protein